MNGISPGDCTRGGGGVLNKRIVDLITPQTFFMVTREGRA